VITHVYDHNWVYNCFIFLTDRKLRQSYHNNIRSIMKFHQRPALRFLVVILGTYNKISTEIYQIQKYIYKDVFMLFCVFIEKSAENIKLIM